MTTAETSLRSLPVSRKHPAQGIHCDTAEGTLTLRPLRLSDAEQMERATSASLPELKPFMPWAHGERSGAAQLERRASTEAAYFGGGDLSMGLFLPDETMLVCCSLHFRVALNPRGVDCGYWTRSDYSRKGYATLALRIMTLYAFDKLDCDRVQVTANDENSASKRVIEKAGFVFEGTLRNFAAAPSPAQIAGGHVSSRRSGLWALISEDLPDLPWVEPLRARLRYINMAGYTV